MSDAIESVTVVTASGYNSHRVGCDGVKSIATENLIVDGNPYSFYVGRDSEGQMMFKISAVCPVEVTYLPFQ